MSCRALLHLREMTSRSGGSGTLPANWTIMGVDFYKCEEVAFSQGISSGVAVAALIAQATSARQTQSLNLFGRAAPPAISQKCSTSCQCCIVFSLISARNTLRPQHQVPQRDIGLFILCADVIEKRGSAQKFTFL